jgi:hypothetical protein
VTGYEWLTVFVAAPVVCWVVSLAWHPYQPCPRCKERRGRNVGSKTARYGRCGKCGGKGERARRGAQAVRKSIGRPL